MPRKQALPTKIVDLQITAFWAFSVQSPQSSSALSEEVLF